MLMIKVPLAINEDGAIKALAAVCPICHLTIEHDALLQLALPSLRRYVMEGAYQGILDPGPISYPMLIYLTLLTMTSGEMSI